MAGLDGTNREYLTSKVDLCDLLLAMQKQLRQWDPPCVLELLPGDNAPSDAECTGNCRECIGDWLNKPRR